MSAETKKVGKDEFISQWTETVRELKRLKWNLEVPQIVKLDKIIEDLESLVLIAADNREDA